MVINGYAEMGELVTEPDSVTHEYFEKISMAGEQARGVTSQILRFSRKGQDEYQPMLIYPVIKEGLKFLKCAMPPFIELKNDIYTGPETVIANPTELHQLLMNLFTNSIHAIGENKGVVEVNLRKRQIDSSSLAGNYLELVVKDSGCGIAPADISRIFDHFYTTKPEGEGTGLGLSIVKSIVTSMGGIITAENSPEGGAAFIMLFPIVNKKSVADEHHQQDELPGGHEKILVVDDNKPVLLLTKHMLEYLGYEITVCETGLRALDVFMDSPESFDLAIIDQMLPNIPGSELISRLHAIRSDFPVILWTGFSSVLSTDSARKKGARCLLLKPLNIYSLAKTLRQELDSSKKFPYHTTESEILKEP